jgi:hypothetical protein
MRNGMASSRARTGFLPAPDAISVASGERGGWTGAGVVRSDNHTAKVGL